MAEVKGLEARLRRALERAKTPSSDVDLNPGVTLPMTQPPRPAAVLIAIDCSGDDPRVLLTKRASGLKHHPGQIAFPGGKVDAVDTSVEACALREAKEEIGLPPEAVHRLGTLPPHDTVSSFRITPVVGLVEAPFQPVAEPGEVEEAFSVPFWHVADPAQFSVERRRWRGHWRRYYTVPYGPYYIWGATARILRNLADAMVT